MSAKKARSFLICSPWDPVPKNREAWIITMADKICASMEYCHIYIALERGRRVVVAANN